MSKGSSFFLKKFFFFHSFGLSFSVISFFVFISILFLSWHFSLYSILSLIPMTNFGTRNEGLYIMTSQNNLTDTGVLIRSQYKSLWWSGLSCVSVPEHHTPRNPHAAFPSREYIANIQLSSPNHLLEWLSQRATPSQLGRHPPGL